MGRKSTESEQGGHMEETPEPALNELRNRLVPPKKKPEAKLGGPIGSELGEIILSEGITPKLVSQADFLDPVEKDILLGVINGESFQQLQKRFPNLDEIYIRDNIGKSRFAFKVLNPNIRSTEPGVFERAHDSARKFVDSYLQSNKIPESKKVKGSKLLDELDDLEITADEIRKSYESNPELAISFAILICLMNGLNYKQIAQELNVNRRFIQLNKTFLNPALNKILEARKLKE